ncbi:MAG: propionate CoA-transferase [Oscillospiraceae bacterium]|nr:propionate CoA-transferase [Oscillospiraceae bacterium]
MPRFLSPDDAVKCIKDGDCIIFNNFLSLNNAEQLSGAIGRRFQATGSPKDLTVYCTAGLGGWDPTSQCESFICMGAAKTVICSHYGSMPGTAQMILDGKLEGYNLPYGAMSHAVRAAAGGQSYIISDAGLNLFVDPKYKGYQLNALAKRELVREIYIDGKRRLMYETPKPDVALLKASSCDEQGNITMEDEPMMGDALSVAQAVRRRGGTVIVQVKSMLKEPRRPIEVVIPSVLVDIICICPEQTQVQGIPEDNPSYSGAKPMTDEELQTFATENAGSGDPVKVRIARRAVQELRPGHVVNIGVGAPEFVAVEAARNGLLPQITLTVEAGAIKGMPAGGRAFGATHSPQSICTTAEQFDFYDGGGLDICFIGALEVDGEGNVNGHYHPKKLSGIGGFINITQFTHKVVFCTTFSAGGLEIADTEDGLKIVREGRIPKFVQHVNALSFSAQNAHENRQEVVYVTERCVFQLGEKGLILTDVARGIDVQKEILDLLPFEVEVAKDLKIY